MPPLATKQVLAYHLGRLKDKNAQVRLNAIAQLRLLEDEDSLEALRVVVETDPDLNVRKAAQEAAKVIFIKTKGAR